MTSYMGIFQRGGSVIRNRLKSYRAPLIGAVEGLANVMSAPIAIMHAAWIKKSAKRRLAAAFVGGKPT
jgi:hypothetical protein